ncbi:UDP-N-acetylmuramoyl-tripeptide--D-alanyl-D-alanine ligase [Caproiciproducens galactitolivorans]|uniref:UDP-N-acetylmuramoyl-tripeptide--D-alanyl-D-alanine ligase n=1 Tax=Caproiciproducens galactitolivorans TaxID=642589 RepID=A0A4Z0YEI1_9FIRM|nr:UDP-N-acetylmuramoyl-tripeptide--D-alanyl-D-alanine ligase [Caproiciproducens galactitolivorans]QEY34420.1 UDP-N-acetylmuramoyl-tripeptide--D-alanyl-D-alanine ligase [Caproiciproducens galactitolivorans]TGJ77805.1 UDP-N-acetylmuramoyl-tripeptide--D-alanyl-D-alanine ligase [Caproiciproducens galactitolivorans]
MKMTAREIAEACGGRLLCGDPDTVVTSVSTDSRKIDSGTLFVPIKGERTNAHTFIGATFAAGALATLTQEHDSMEDRHVWIRVQSTEQALQQIAAAYRKRFSIPFVGITGSVGKTTTKEMVALALSAGLNVMKTEGNFNSQIGLPLTMFTLDKSHQVAVVEMGMSDFGEMSRLAQIAAPDYAVVTNIGISHIEQLKTQQNIMNEKLHITDCFHKNSVLFLNGDDRLLTQLRNTAKFKIVWFGTQSWCDFRADNIRTEKASTRFTLVAPEGLYEVRLPALGIHNVTNALVGLAVAKTLGVPLEKAIAKLAEYRPLAMRQQIHRVNEVTVIDDSYNASPDAIRSSVDVLCGFHTGKRIAVLADMLELGEYSQKAHFDVGEYAAKAGIDALVTVGERAKEIVRGARSVHPELPCFPCGDNSEAITKLKSILMGGDAVLVKGSRAMKTDQIVKALL